MANGYFERGEMYDILFNEGFDGEIAAHRPGIIVSNDKGNRTSPTVLMVYTTTSNAPNKNIGVNCQFTLNGWTNYVLCNQIATINKTRLKKFYGRVTDADMDAIDACLEEALDLGYVDDTALKEKDTEIAALNLQISDLRKEIANLNEQLAKHEDDESVHRVEVEMWQRLYDKALDQVCSMKLNGDITRRAEKQPELPKPPVKEQPQPKVEPGLVDINSASFDALKACGISNNIILQIVNRRPHKSVEDLKKIPGVTNVLYGIVSKKVCCIAPKIKSALPQPDTGCEEDEVSLVKTKVNINTATGKEIAEALGMCRTTAYNITGYRKKHGRYTCLEELLNVPQFGQRTLDRFRDMLEV